MTPGLAALHALPGVWADEQEQHDSEAFVHAQAAERGIRAEDIERLYQQMRDGQLRLADVLGMTPGQLAAMAYRAHELLRGNEAKKALSIYLALYELDPYEFSYQRGAAQCFHTMRQYGFACGYYRLAMATLGAPDFVCMAMIAECLLWLDDKATCLQALDAALAIGSERKHEQLFVERAEAFRQRLMIEQK